MSIEQWQPKKKHRLGQKVIVVQGGKEFLLRCDQAGESGEEDPIPVKALAAKGSGNKYETSSVVRPIADGTVLWRLSAARY